MKKRLHFTLLLFINRLTVTRMELSNRINIMHINFMLKPYGLLVLSVGLSILFRIVMFPIIIYATETESLPSAAAPAVTPLPPRADDMVSDLPWPEYKQFRVDESRKSWDEHFIKKPGPIDERAYVADITMRVKESTDKDHPSITFEKGAYPRKIIASYGNGEPCGLRPNMPYLKPYDIKVHCDPRLGCITSMHPLYYWTDPNAKVFPMEEVKAKFQPTLESKTVPTEVPNKVPTEVPNKVPTEVPNKVPTEVPNKVPTKVLPDKSKTLISKSWKGVPHDQNPIFLSKLYFQFQKELAVALEKDDDLTLMRFGLQFIKKNIPSEILCKNNDQLFDPQSSIGKLQTALEMVGQRQAQKMDLYTMAVFRTAIVVYNAAILRSEPLSESELLGFWTNMFDTVIQAYHKVGME
jgi:hypothetical protein